MEPKRDEPERQFNKGNWVAIIIDSGPFKAGDVVPVREVRTLRKQGGELDHYEVYVVNDEAGLWIPEDSVVATVPE